MPRPSFARPTPLPAPTFLAYTVKSGDTLTSIARIYRTTPRSIAFWSRGEHPSLDPESATYEPDRLEVGWTLLLVPDTVFDEDELMDATPSPAPAESAGG
jgi:spore germination protein YaaH